MFSVEALGTQGIELSGKNYFLLSDIDIGADLRKFYQPETLFSELYERQSRRHPVWKSYYEYKHLFSNKEQDITEEDVFVFFKPLIDYLKNSEMFVLDTDGYNRLKADSDASEQSKIVADLLYEFFTRQKLHFNIVLLTSTNSFSPKFNPSSVFILFSNLPKRNGANYATYAFLKESDERKENDSHRLFYLYSKDKLTIDQLDDFRTNLFSELLKHRGPLRV